jgi:hypothetical protein
MVSTITANPFGGKGPPCLRRRERARASGAAVVPDHQVTGVPVVPIDESRLRCEFDQLGQQRLATFRRKNPSADALG